MNYRLYRWQKMLRKLPQDNLKLVRKLNVNFFEIETPFQVRDLFQFINKLRIITTAGKV